MQTILIISLLTFNLLSISCNVLESSRNAEKQKSGPSSTSNDSTSGNQVSQQVVLTKLSESQVSVQGSINASDFFSRMSLSAANCSDFSLSASISGNGIVNMGSCSNGSTPFNLTLYYSDSYVFTVTLSSSSGSASGTINIPSISPNSQGTESYSMSIEMNSNEQVLSSPSGGDNSGERQATVIVDVTQSCAANSEFCSINGTATQYYCVHYRQSGAVRDRHYITDGTIQSAINGCDDHVFKEGGSCQCGRYSNGP